MRTLLPALLLFVTLSANKCKNDQGVPMTDLLEKKWVFQTLAGEAVTLPEGVEKPWVQLTGDQVQGFGGCNRLMGSYVLDGAKLSFPGLGSTKKYCEGIQPVEDKVKSALSAADSFTMKGGLLTLLGAGKAVATLKSE
jgi:heat shock protein HslJ